VLLGLGWSAATVAGSALLTEASAEPLRTRRQGRSDLTMNLVGALGAISAGVILGWIGYGGLAAAAIGAVVLVVGLMPVARARDTRENAAQPPTRAGGDVRVALAGEDVKGDAPAPGAS
jgi:MFS family permease